MIDTPELARLVAEASPIVDRIERDIETGRPVQVGRLFAAVGALTELVNYLRSSSTPGTSRTE